MAGARVEKIGSVFKRVQGLLRGGVLTESEKPLWYDVYKAFPPQDEPTMQRPEPRVAVKSIVYMEDHIRKDFMDKYARELSDMTANEQQTAMDRYVAHFTKHARNPKLDVQQIVEATLYDLKVKNIILQPKEIPQKRKQKSNVTKTHTDTDPKGNS